MRRLGLIVILATAVAACAGEPSGAAGGNTTPIDVSGIPSRLRMLVAPSRTFFRMENGVYRGDTVDHAAAFKKWLNTQANSTSYDIEFIETPQEALIPDLLAGKGDIAANLLLTFERDDQVAFAKPLLTGIRELVVTGPAEKPLVSLEDVGHRTIYVRKSSDHHASLLRLNDQLTKINRPPARIVVSTAPTDEDLLEMVNAGKVPATIADNYVFERWRKTFDRIAANPDVAVSQDGILAWVTRKDAPKLLALMNEFFSSHKLTF